MFIETNFVRAARARAREGERDWPKLIIKCPHNSFSWNASTCNRQSFITKVLNTSIKAYRRVSTNVMIGSLHKLYVEDNSPRSLYKLSDSFGDPGYIARRRRNQLNTSLRKMLLLQFSYRLKNNGTPLSKRTAAPCKSKVIIGFHHAPSLNANFPRPLYKLIDSFGIWDISRAGENTD